MRTMAPNRAEQIENATTLVGPSVAGHGSTWQRIESARIEQPPSNG